ncbi:amino acid adenylation domain-containing protein [Micromonospora sp. NPDC005172]|uniref:amino acid adenylation domain-containing protein n=1 Tax=Micromonospora sp. NPDC005172 TaxID=3156867 RepID=UPI00339FFF06
MTGGLPDVVVGREEAAVGAQEPLAAVHELVRERASTHPNAVALDGLSYQELDSWGDRIAWGLMQSGVRPGTPVASRQPAGADNVASLLGIFKAGCYVVPLSQTDPFERCVEILREIKPTGLLVERGAPEDELISWYRTAASGPVLQVLARDDVRPESPSALAASDHAMAGHPERILDAPAYVVYTSGTTGRPKGIVQSHRGLVQLVQWLGAEFRMGPDRRTAQWSATNYDASLCEIFATLVAGGTLCPVPDSIRYDAGLLLDWLATQQVNVLQTVPSFGRELLHAIGTGVPTLDLTSLDHILFAGEPLPGDLATGMASAIPSVRLANLYGTTEIILATWMEVSEGWVGTVPAGSPIPGCLVLVLDSDDRPCPVGVSGEIVVCSPFLALGYVGDAQESDSGFGTMMVSVADGLKSEVRCYRTGDRGHWRPDGLLEFEGRRDRQVKLRGARVELAEIEAALVSHPSIIQCVVVPSDSDDGLVQQLVAYVVPTSGTGSPEIWRAHLRRRLNDQMVPDVFVTLETLPRNAGGKVDASRLPAPGQVSQAERSRSGTSSRLGHFRSWSAGLAQVLDESGEQTRKDE